MYGEIVSGNPTVGVNFGGAIYDDICTYEYTAEFYAFPVLQLQVSGEIFSCTRLLTLVPKRSIASTVYQFRGLPQV